MNYLDAKSELLNNSPRIPFNLIAIEAVVLVVVAILMVWVMG